MADMKAHGRLYVSTDGNAGPYIVVPVEQLVEIRSLLDTNQVVYWVDEEAISFDGNPEIAVVNLGRSGDAASVQQLLDRFA